MSQPAPGPEKVCILCKQDCSKRPRTKDEQGRYTCKACADARQKQLAAMQAKPTAPKPAAPKPAAAAAAPPTDDDNGFMASLIDQSPSTGPAAAPGAACPECAMPMHPGAVVCMACGYNQQTGKKSGVKVTKERQVPTAVAATAKGTAVLVGAAIGAVIAGIVAAAVWGGIGYAVHREYGIIAWGVGVLVGLGAASGAMGKTSTMTGLIAAVVAIAAVFGGRYAALSLITDQITGQLINEIVVDDDMAKGLVAQNVVKEWTAAGKVLRWPEGTDPDTVDDASSEEEFPKDVWTEATRRWTSATEDWRQDFKASHEASFRAEFTQVMSAATSEGFFESLGALDLVWMLLALVSAYGVGSGTGVGGDD